MMERGGGAVRGRGASGAGRPAALALAVCAWPADALAHAAERGHVMLLPTGHYLAGGALAVALSFAILAWLRPEPLDRLMRARLALPAPPDVREAASWLSVLALAGLLSAGFAGSRDPLSNPLPLVFWTLLWVGLVLAQGLVGDLWRRIEPWYGPWRLVARLAGRGRLVRYPKSLGRWPAIAGLLGFAWFELVYVAPADPARLATAIGLYWLLTFAAMVVFGHRDWRRNGEFLSIFLAMVARIAVLGRGRKGVLSLSLPGARLPDQPALAPSGIAFLLLALASVSFDGLSGTFSWMGLVGVNPLEFPGRSAVTGVNTIGLLATFAVLALAFLGAVAAGERLAGRRDGFWEAAGALAWSLLPISFAYHFAHYFGSLLLNGQYALAAISDPLSRGWNLFGTAGMHVSAGVTAGAEMARVMWNLQVAAIVAGHVLAVACAHLVAWRRHGDRRLAALGQLPLALLMVGYTVFGLWLLSTPTGR